MPKVNKNNLEKYGYTIIYYEIVNETKMSFKEYIVLETILISSKKHEYKKGIVFLEKKFNYTRNTVRSLIDKLYNKGFVIEKNGTDYILNQDLKEHLKPLNNSYGIKIYHKHRIELGLNLNEYAILYLFYSYSKKWETKETYSGYEEFKNKIDKKESQFYRAKNRLIELGLIRPTRKDYITLTESIFNWFKIQENIKNDCI